MTAHEFKGKRKKKNLQAFYAFYGRATYWFKISSLSRSSLRGWQRLDIHSPIDQEEPKGDRKHQGTEQRPRDKAGLSQEERSGDMGGWAHISSAPLHVDRNPHCEVERHALGQVSFRSLQHQSMPRQISKGQRQPGDTSQPPHPSASNSSNQCTRVGVRNRGDNRHKRKRQPFMDSYNKYNREKSH